MRTKVITRSMLVAVLFTAIPLYSATGTATPTPALSGAAQATHLANLKTRGAAEIDRRLAALNTALTKLGASTKLGQSDKAALTAQVTAETTALTALKAKLAADTDLATARVDVQSIVTEYRVYVLMLPKARLVAATDHLVLVEGQLTDLQAKLKTKIDATTAAGKDTTAMTASLTDLSAKIAATKVISDGFVAKLLALQPTDYNADHTILETYRTSLVTARTDIKAARDDAVSIITALKAANAK